MYSRKTSFDERGINIPPHYSGTALRKSTLTEKRDAVGRPSALQNDQSEAHITIHDQRKEIQPREKIPTPKIEKPTNILPKKSDDKEDDTLFVCALLLSLIGTKGEREEDITLILLILVLIL